MVLASTANRVTGVKLHIPVNIIGQVVHGFLEFFFGIVTNRFKFVPRKVSFAKNCRILLLLVFLNFFDFLAILR